MLSEHGEVKMSALGAAMSALVTVAEILKSRGLAVEKKITTSLEELESDNGEGCVEGWMVMNGGAGLDG